MHSATLERVIKDADAEAISLPLLICADTSSAAGRSWMPRPPQERSSPRSHNDEEKTPVDAVADFMSGLLPYAKGRGYTGEDAASAGLVLVREPRTGI